MNARVARLARRSRRPAFTLVELLVTIAIVAALAAIAVAGLLSARTKAAEIVDLTKMRALGGALHCWAADHHGKLPRSSHSAIGHGELGWQRELLPHLGQQDSTRETWLATRETLFGIDPDESPARGPALNVYFELDPEHDDYEGAPKHWRNLASVPAPSSTVLVVMAPGTADHVMAQYVTSRASDLPAPRKGRRQGCVLWLDGRASMENPGSLLDPPAGVDHFHPEKAALPPGAAGG